MKLLLYADTHFHNWSESERPDHWRNLVGVIGRVYRIALREECDWVVHLGDLFESKRRIRSDVISTVFTEIIKHHTASGLRSAFVAGNHDFYGSECILTPLGEIPGISIFGVGGTLPGSRVVCAPWGTESGSVEVDRVRGIRSTILLFHGNVEGAAFSDRPGSRRCVKSDLELLSRQAGNRSSGPVFAVGGHIHNPQTRHIQGDKGRSVVAYCGPPYQLSWSDADSRVGRGCATLDCETLAYKRFIFNDYPKFWTSDGPHVRPQDFVRGTSKVTAEVRTRVHKNHEVIGGDSAEHAIAEYVKLKCNQPENEERLIQVGLDLYHASGGME